MRDTFPEFYAPDATQLADTLTRGRVVFDTNVLLGLYRFSDQWRAEVFAVLDRIKDRVWIPYQVGLEYQRNRRAAIDEQRVLYSKVKQIPGQRSHDVLAKALGDLDDLADEVKLEIHDLLPDLAARLRDAVAPYVEAVEEIQARHSVTSDPDQDEVRDFLDSIFQGRVGAPAEEAVLAERLEEYERRRRERVPPGFEDGDKDTPERQAGDYLIWEEILDYAESIKDVQLPLLFVTDDTKEDWYVKKGKKVLAPRPELIKEYGTRSPHRYHQVTSRQFLELAREHLGATVSEETLKTAEDRADYLSPSVALEMADLIGSVEPLRVQVVDADGSKHSLLAPRWILASDDAHPNVSIRSTNGDFFQTEVDGLKRLAKRQLIDDLVKPFPSPTENLRLRLETLKMADLLRLHDLVEASPDDIEEVFRYFFSEGIAVRRQRRSD